MDLGTIKKNVMDRKYKRLKDVDDDVKLVWTNCMTYNADGSDFFILAQNQNKKWIDKFSKLLNDFHLNPDGTSTTSNTSNDRSNKTSSISNSSGTNGKISLDEKRSFAKSLYKISKEDLGKILVQVENKCPSALTKNSAEDEVEFNVDKLTSSAFHDLVSFVKGCTNNSSSGNSNNNKTASSTGNNQASSGVNSGISGSSTKSKKNNKRKQI